MAQPSSINPRIIDGLYAEAIVLADELRQTFTLTDRLESGGDPMGDARLAASCEALRATTRMMHALAWLLNHRAYFNGELSDFQLRRHGKLVDFPENDATRLALLDPAARSLIEATEQFHARLKRIDTAWRERDPDAPSAIATLRDRLVRSARA